MYLLTHHEFETIHDELVNVLKCAGSSEEMLIFERVIFVK
jgi:hypothetical protein